MLIAMSSHPYSQAMAAMLCETASWWPLATLYQSMAANAAAGVRHELLPLMGVPQMDPIKARALFQVTAGFHGLCWLWLPLMLNGILPLALTMGAACVDYCR